MPSVFRIFLCGCAFAALTSIVGCGSSTRPNLGEVRGKLTLDGQPLTDAQVIFAPDTGGRKSTGRPNAQGEYELTYIRDIKGAKVGPHTIRISTINKAGRKPERVCLRGTTFEAS